MGTTIISLYNELSFSLIFKRTQFYIQTIGLELKKLETKMSYFKYSLCKIFNYFSFVSCNDSIFIFDEQKRHVKITRFFSFTLALA